METKKNKFQTFIRNEEHERFNAEIASLVGAVDLEGCNLSNQDLRQFNLRTANLRNAYMKMADLRGVDLSEAQMDGASINRAHISGAFFPRTVPAQEIWLSIEHGTRMRATP
jgi:uncharacterized protein YjbI with pentapeptide repeats